MHVTKAQLATRSQRQNGTLLLTDDVVDRIFAHSEQVPSATGERDSDVCRRTWAISTILLLSSVKDYITDLPGADKLLDILSVAWETDIIEPTGTVP